MFAMPKTARKTIAAALVGLFALGVGTPTYAASLAVNNMSNIGGIEYTELAIDPGSKKINRKVKEAELRDYYSRSRYEREKARQEQEKRIERERQKRIERERRERAMEREKERIARERARAAAYHRQDKHRSDKHRRNTGGNNTGAVIAGAAIGYILGKVT